MTRQITPAILARALEQERCGEARPQRSALREILAKLAANGVDLAVVRRGRGTRS